MKEMPSLEICFSPALLHLANTKDAIVVIIDIYRATSTITAALGNGAQAVIPVASVAECIALNQENSAILTAGERDGKIAAGLQYGNSPLAFPPDFAKDKTIALTTTNGTRLLKMVNDAHEIIIGSFLNIDAVCNFLIKSGKNVLLACASWKDRVNLEDTLFAGAVANKIAQHFSIHSDSVTIAKTLDDAAQQAPSLFEYLKNATHYHRLSAYGLEADLRYCSQQNLFDLVPILKNDQLIPYKND